jgi:hypothetical protein
VKVAAAAFTPHSGIKAAISAGQLRQLDAPPGGSASLMMAYLQY